ncbi:hypothetical protein Ppa06_02600 [Planomonospora parontospora subsp. parontospora]|uniref:Uncharacterized protein n=2 Tax=Planomonospora parontospora TaxID=58119 RepID=A0AA37F257_9ACTN|nr:hypothetical protein GCM10010126_02610 [Planomonospora parontospora]GII06462.1 hypothetical protein Ppa06_02600 [Planomonospora parontospora subsp. parontospora]
MGPHRPVLDLVNPVRTVQRVIELIQPGEGGTGGLAGWTGQQIVSDHVVPIVGVIVVEIVMVDETMMARQ